MGLSFLQSTNIFFKIADKSLVFQQTVKIRPHIHLTFSVHPTTLQTEIIYIELWKIVFKILPLPSSNTVFTLFISKTLQRENI